MPAPVLKGPEHGEQIRDKHFHERIADQNALPMGKAAKQPLTKKQRLQTLLRRKGGASLDALQKEFGWQPHTVRAAISGVRKAGNTVVCEAGKSGPVYRIVDASAVS